LSRTLLHRAISIDSNENSSFHANPSKFTKSRNSNSSVQILFFPFHLFVFVLGDTEKSEILDWVDFGDVVLLVEIVKLRYEPRYYLKKKKYFTKTGQVGFYFESGQKSARYYSVFKKHLLTATEQVLSCFGSLVKSEVAVGWLR